MSHQYLVLEYIHSPYQRTYCFLDSVKYLVNIAVNIVIWVICFRFQTCVM